MLKTSKNLCLSSEVLQSQEMGLPIVALESAVITHGLPHPENLNLALDMEKAVRAEGAVPATIALIKGTVRAGLEEAEIRMLAEAAHTRKISLRDLGIAVAQELSGGTTVATSIFAAEVAGIKVFATGGIGGVHRNAAFDVSADLPQLGRSQVVVVCAGAKAILDLPATLEYLETQGVPVVGYQTDEFPAFYSRSSGLHVDIKADSAEDVAEIARAHWDLGLKSAILVVVPPPAEDAMSLEVVEKAIASALQEANKQGIHGAAITPFLLGRVSELSSGESLKTNLSLLLNNGRVAAKIAKRLAG
jgi:pseudouridine-5'-phosphate glycosidase